MRRELFDAVADCIDITDPETKTAAVRGLRKGWRAGVYSIAARAAPRPIGPPGRPRSPELVSPSEVPRRGLGSPEGRAALVHAVAHIEFNAINLALDAAYRFRGLPAAFYDDWLRVAADEARHFTWLSARLDRMGYRYGDFVAHNGLWETAEDTADDVMVRMALVPRVLEARGLDVTPGMIQRLTGVGDQETADILDAILREEVAHVAIGSHWYERECRQRGLDPEATFRRLLDRYLRGRVHGPFNRPARLEAGFSERELDGLEAFVTR